VKTNMGGIDRIARLVTAAVIAVLYLTGQIKGELGIYLAILAVGFFVTGLAGLCPLYIPFKISTKKKPKPAA